MSTPPAPPALDDPGRYTVIGHRDMSLWHPHDPGALERLIDRAGLAAGSTALDIGCGRAEVALRIIERTGAAVRAVDASAAAIARARSAAAQRDPDGRLTTIHARFDAAAEAPVDLAVCIGSLHVLGALSQALDVLDALVHPGGRLVLGDGFWAHEPDPQWLARRFGGQADAFRSWAAIVDDLARAGWRLVDSHRVSAAGWRAYETRHNANVRATDAVDAEALRARSDGWFEDWKRWGSALGFGLWLVERS